VIWRRRQRQKTPAQIFDHSAGVVASINLVLRRFTNDILMTETQVHVASKLFNLRDSMRSLHGKNWKTKIEEITPIIRGVAKEYNLSVLAAAMQISEKAIRDGQPMASAQVLAVACELSENVKMQELSGGE